MPQEGQGVRVECVPQHGCVRVRVRVCVSLEMERKQVDAPPVQCRPLPRGAHSLLITVLPPLPLPLWPQFSVDDLQLHRLPSLAAATDASTSGQAGPYRRAVCVPFGDQQQTARPQAQPAAAAPVDALLPTFAQQVVWAVQNHLRRSQQLQHAVAAAAVGSAGPAIDLLGLAAHLEQWGLKVALAAPGRFWLDGRSTGSWGTATPYLVVSGACWGTTAGYDVAPLLLCDQSAPPCRNGALWRWLL